MNHPIHVNKHITKIKIVTAFFDIGRGNWNYCNRSVDVYMNSFKKLLTFHDNIIVFLDDRYINSEFILNYKENKKNGLTKKEVLFIPINREWLNNNCLSWKKNYISEAIMNSEIYINKIRHRRHYPENSCSEYNAVNHSKIDFIKYAIDNRLVYDNEFICWCDFGYYNSILSNDPFKYPYAELDINKFDINKINMCLRNKLEYNDFNMDFTLIYAPEKFTGSLFSANVENMIKLHHLYHECLDELYKNYITDDDQHVYLRCFHKKQELFNLFLSDTEWPKALTYFQYNFTNHLDFIKYYIESIKDGVFVEIGISNSDLSNFLLKNNKTCKLYAIDIYTSNDSIGDKMYVETLIKLKTEFKNRIELLRCSSNDASNIIENDLDFVYIGGNHNYKYVLEDLELWYKKLKIGGFIICNNAIDINDDGRNDEGDVQIELSPGSYHKYGVINACKTFVEKNNLSFSKYNNQIIIFKPIYSKY